MPSKVPATIKLNKITRNKEDYLLWKEDRGGAIEIVDIAVYSERERGIGRSMVQELVDKGKTIYAFSRQDNVVALRFYTALGFRQVKIINFYDDGHAFLNIYEKGNR
jgi:ribosomal protein S18 acetylase RimI-like enzyme